MFMPQKAAFCQPRGEKCGLERRLEIHRNTISLAFGDLVKKGLLVRHRGKRLVVRSPEQPSDAAEAKDLDEIIDRTVRIARQHGYTIQQLRHRLRARLLAEPPDHILALSIDAGMRALFRMELTEAVGCRVETHTPDKLAENPGLAAGALVVSPPAHMPQVLSVLPRGHPVVGITYSQADAHVEMVRNLKNPSLIAVVSISQYFLKTARGVLAPAVGRKHSMREYLLESKHPETVGAADIMFCDSMIYRMMKAQTRRANAVAYQLISADCLARVSSELSESVTGDFDRK